MKAAGYAEYGPPEVLCLQEVATPAPKDHEVLIRVRASTVGFGDLMARKFGMVGPRQFTMPFLFWLLARIEFGFRKPRKTVLGAEFSGDVEAVGPKVSRFRQGDQVFGYTGPRLGTNAEYICLPETGMLAAKPRNLGYEEAASLPYGALTALNLLRRAGIRSGDAVLVNGASGGIGSFAVQFAKHWGAAVTGVCSAGKLDFVRGLGADAVLDYTREDFTAAGAAYDVILDILGKSSFAQCKGSLKPGGRYLLASFKLRQICQMLWTRLAGGKRVVCALSLETPKDLEHIRQLAETGGIRPRIDRTYPLHQVAEAHRHAESGRKAGSIVLTIP